MTLALGGRVARRSWQPGSPPLPGPAAVIKNSTHSSGLQRLTPPAQGLLTGRLPRVGGISQVDLGTLELVSL